MVITTRYPFGRNIYESEWDLLIVLDACRTDALRSVASEYDYLESVGEITSLGSTSLEWMLKTFVEEYREDIEKTRYISTNGHLGHLVGRSSDYFSFSPLNETKVANSARLNRFVNRTAVSESDFDTVDHLYHLPENNPYGHTPLPEDVTDYSIKVGRENDPKRMIIHYMQPHAPYLKGAIERGRIERYEDSPFEALRGGQPFERVWDAYLDNLRFVLDSVERLLRNFDAETVVITADHGDLFGELGLYSHIPGVFHPRLKRVPWTETTAHDTGEYVPNAQEIVEDVTESEMQEHIQKQLASLGYI